jgi:hypothetical protein
MKVEVTQTRHTKIETGPSVPDKDGPVLLLVCFICVTLHGTAKVTC